ncbi:MAG: ureidoglycolate hydrolase, partial [Pseudomonadota bacterium]
MTQSTPTYLFEPAEKPSLDVVDVPLIEATDDSVKGYGHLVDQPDDVEIEIVRWPQQGWRPVDDGTGDEAGWVEGVFHGSWAGDVLMGTNDAVNGHYVLGWSTD